MKVLGIIPARGGSKGVPQKNIRLIHGKPLISYTIALAESCKSFMDYIVSTDDEKIEKIAVQYGAHVIKRPPEIATDASSVVDTVSHVLNTLGTTYDLILLLQPTSPLRDTTDIQHVIKMFSDDPGLDGVVSVVKVSDKHPARMYAVNNDEYLDSFIEGGETLRRQELEPLYYRNGAIYAVKTDVFLKSKTLMPKYKKAYVMDHRWAVNIDEEIDIQLLELLLPKWIATHENFNH